MLPVNWMLLVHRELPTNRVMSQPSVTSKWVSQQSVMSQLSVTSQPSVIVNPLMFKLDSIFEPDWKEWTKMTLSRSLSWCAESLEKSNELSSLILILFVVWMWQINMTESSGKKECFNFKHNCKSRKFGKDKFELIYLY